MLLTKKYIHIIIIFISILFNNEQNYIWPTDASKTLTAFFGEMRPNRYHYGIDIRTFGKIGQNIYSIDDGYVYRIKISNDGYGKAIYIKLTDNNIVLYSHLSKFNPEIEKISNQMQKMRNSYEIDHFVEPGLIQVKKGEIIGYTGDTGSLSGPHLHFEIRDQINRPLNPLKTNLGEFLTDTKSPIPEKIAIIPKSLTSKIHGENYLKTYTINQIKKNQYHVKDTIYATGNFGICLKVNDKLDNQPFNYGIYSINLFIDTLLQYSIRFDKTSFKQGPQSYIERDYDLMVNNNEEFYRLFRSSYEDNYFVNSESKEFIQLNQGVHPFKIYIRDINNNKSIVSGNISIKNPLDLNYEIHELEINNAWMININEIDKINSVNLTLSNKNADNKKIHPNFEIINDTSIVVYDINETYNVLKMNIETNKGPHRTKFALLGEQTFKETTNLTKEIKGYTSINHNDEGISIIFNENQFSNELPYLIYKKDGKLNRKKMNRKSQNQLISEIFTIAEFLKIENIKIEYENEYIYSKNFDIEKMITYPNLFSEKTFQNGQISITHEENTFFDTTLIYITKPNLKINNKSIINPFYIGPNAIPFNKEITLSISLFDNKNIEHCVISKYSKEKKQWIPLKTSINQKTLTTKIRQGSIIGVLVDNEKPKINNIIPRNGATYLLNDINDFEIILTDDYSKIDYRYGLKLKLNGKQLLTGFNIYQNKLQCNIKGVILDGKNTFELSVSDNANNINKINGTFNIIDK